MRKHIDPKTIVTLVRNTTFKCGRLQRRIIQHLRRKEWKVTVVQELLNKLSPRTAKEKWELLDAIRRLAKRNIIEMQLPK